MHCPNCDYANPADARFCNGCGASLAASDSITATEGVTLPVAAASAPPDAPVVATPSAVPLAVPSAAPPVPVAPTPVAAPINVNVTVNAPVTPAVAATPVVIVAQQASGPGCLVRGLYFLCVGLWLGALWTGAAWFLLVSIIGLPIGLLMLNRLPQVMTLKPIRSQTQVTMQGNVVMVGHSTVPQRSFWARAVYFLLVGWWLSGLWLGVAWGLIGATFGLALPLSFWMFDRTPAIVSLARQ